MNKILTKADKLQKIQELKKIPNELLPSTLKYNLQLPNIRKITLEYRDQCKDIGPTFQFIRKYSADIKFHNPDIVIERKRIQDGPIKLKLAVYTKDSNEAVAIDPANIPDVEALKDKIEKIGNKVI